MTTDLTTAVGVLTAIRPLFRVLETGAEDSTELRVTVVGGESAGVYIEVLPSLAEDLSGASADELSRIAAVDRLAALLGTSAELAAVGGQHYYQVQTEADGMPVEVTALLPHIDDAGLPV